MSFEMSAKAKRGAVIFQQNCVSCHNKQPDDVTPFGPPNLHGMFSSKPLVHPALTPAQAEGLLRQLKGVKLLEGFRGMPGVDIGRLAQVISDVSRFAADHRDAVAELDIKPLICAGERITAVDALIVVSCR